jgi:hypothetical protein
MKIKVVAFQVTPICILMDNEGVVHGEVTAPSFKFYPGAPFDIKKTIEQLEVETIDQAEGGSNS